MQQLLEWIVNHPLTGLIVFTGLIQIVPIKINPWSALFKWISTMLTGNACGKIDNLMKQIDENEKDRIRWEVLNFATSCRQGCKHTRDEFQHIIALNDKYEKLLERTHDSNGVFDAEYKYIQELYAENDFL